MRKGQRVRVVKHRNERVAGMTGRIVELERPSGLLPGYPGSAWVHLDGSRKEAFCCVADLIPLKRGPTEHGGS